MVQVIARSLKILEIIPEKEEGFGVLELAKRVGLPNSTVHRLLNALKKYGYIMQDPSSGKYKLGYKILSLAKKVLENQNLKNISLPYLKKLMQKTGETAHLIIFNGEDAICIESVEPSSNMRICSPIGEINPLHCTAVGKVILAHLPGEEKKAFLKKRLQKYTANTVTFTKKLTEELDAVRKDGYALDREEYQLGIRCIAAPVVDISGKVSASVGISYPSFRVDRVKEKEFIQYLKETCQQINKFCSGD